MMGWCQDATDGEKWGMDPREIAALHLGCPGHVDPMQHPDPSRKGATYTLPAQTCTCVCHTRPLL
jgi:hypothetical protein